MGQGSSKEKVKKAKTESREADPENGELATGITNGGSVKPAKEQKDAKREQDSTAVKKRIKPPNQGPGGKKLQQRVSFYETVDASEVLPYLIVGNLASAKNEEFLVRKNVRYVLNLTSELNETQAEDIEYKSICMEDDEDEDLSVHLEACFDFINQAKLSSTKKDSRVVLVHSYFGLSRTSAVVLAYLMREKQWTLRQAHEYLKERLASIKPNDGFVVQLLRYDQELHDGKMSMTLKDFYQQP